MKWSLSLRALAYLRRLTRAAESIAAAQRQQTNLAQAEWDERHLARRPRKVAEFGTLDIAEANRRWNADREEEMLESDTER